MWNPAVKKGRNAGLAACAVSVLLAGCGDLLKVNDPGRFISDDLDDPRAWDAVANGPEGRMQQGYSLLVIHTALLGGEYQSTGTWGQYRDIANATFVEGGESSQAGLYFQVRNEAQGAAERFERLLGGDAATSPLVGRVKAVEGWSNIILGMLSCETVLVPNGPPVAPAESFRAAIGPLTEAINILSASNNSRQHFARAGRARAHLYLGNLTEALADARAVPDGYAYEAIYSAQGNSNSVVTLTTHTHNKAAGLRTDIAARIDTTGANDVYRDRFTNEPDPRVAVVHRAGNRIGVDGFSKHFSQFKYRTEFDNIRMTSKDEMRLIEAEVLMRQGDLGGAMTLLNAMRARAGLSPVPNPGTETGVRDVLLNERFAVLFMEGHRYHDLERFGLIREVLGANRATKFALPNNETNLNPNVTPPRTCPGRS